MSLLSTQTRCGACGHGNGDTTPFCAGCGQSLFEPCGTCSQSVRLDQKFCGGCGTDLQQRRDQLRKQCQDWLAAAVAAARASEFERAQACLERVAEQKDYRLADLSEKAALAVNKIQKLQAQSEQSAAMYLAQARQALERRDHAAVVEVLARVPAAMRTAEMRQLHDRSAAFVSQVGALEAALQSKLREKDFEGVGQVCEELLGLMPEHERYLQLARQVTVRLTAGSRRRFERQDYPGAVAKLAAVPSQLRDESFQRLRQQVESAGWLDRQLQYEPYTSASLGRLAQRLRSEAPENRAAAEYAEQLLLASKQPLEDPRVPFHRWRGSCAAWTGGEARYLGYPLSVKSDEGARHLPGRFSVAIGLALQGLGSGPVKDAFATRRRLLPLLKGHPAKTSWGIDVGSSGLRAVRLQSDSGALRVAESHHHEFQIPICRRGAETDQVLREAVRKFLASADVGDVPCWVNLPAGELVSRFVRLPPVKDKKADELLTAEIAQGIPLPIESLELVRWMGSLQPASSVGRAAFAGAARKSAVTTRLDAFTGAGLKISGMQSDQLALVNFLSHEFAETLAPEAAPASEALPGIALVDAGAAFTTLLLLTRESFWFWTVESGGEDLTQVLARSTQSPHREAEQRKRCPALLRHPGDEYAGVEQKLEELRARMQKLLAEGLKRNPGMKVVETWCVGGSPLTHAWLRTVLTTARA